MSSKVKQIHTHASHHEPQAELIAAHPRTRAKIPLPPLPNDPDGLARKSQVLEFVGMGNTRFYALIKEGIMPRPIKIGRSSFWRVGEVREAVKRISEGAQP